MSSSTPAFTISAPLSQHRATANLTQTSFLTPLSSHNASFPKPCYPLHTVMALNNVVIAGGTGFVGRALANRLASSGSSVTILTRNTTSRPASPNITYRAWAPDKLLATGNDWVGWQQTLSNADAVYNLAGHPVISRWTAAGKAAILNSRVSATRSIVDSVINLPSAERPKCLINASAIGYYGFADRSRTYDESDPAGGGFLAEVCKSWEGEASRLEKVAETRLVIPRFGVVLGVGGGAMANMIPAFKAFIGGPLGDGQQWMAWIHIDDLVDILLRMGTDPTMSGVYNATSPNAVTMSEMCDALGKAMKRPSKLPVPGFVLKVGLGEGSDVVLEGVRIAPRRLQELSFDFANGSIDTAMANIVAKC